MPFTCFLAAFSVNVATLGRLFWTVLHKDQTKYSVLLTTLWIAFGLTVVVTAFELVAHPISSQLFSDVGIALQWQTTISSFYIAIAFVSLSVAIYREVGRKERQQYHAPSDAAAAAAGRRTTGSPYGSPRGSNAGGGGFGSPAGQGRNSRASAHAKMDSRWGDRSFDIKQPAPNPMRKLVWVSSFCAVCFICRTTLSFLVRARARVSCF